MGPRLTFRETELPGAYVIEPVLIEDERGFFARTYCRREFEEMGLELPDAQANISYSRRRGTLRGLHYQAPPNQEAKLVRCTAGAIHDVILDLRPDSPTYLRHVAARLSARERKMVYVPPGCAHGFQTLEDDTEVAYMMSAFYSPEDERGVRWDDPALAIRWPEPVAVISRRDASHPDFVVETRIG